MAMNNTDIKNSWITQQGFITGVTIAHLFNMEHEVFHNRLYTYYHSLEGNRADEPTIYRQDGNGYYIAVPDSFPYDINAMRADLGTPTYGITSKHLLDLYVVFGEKREIIETLIKVLMNVIKVSENGIEDAFTKAKQCVSNQKEFIYDFEGVSKFSKEDAEELLGKILIQEGLHSVKFRNLSTEEFHNIFEGINAAFSKKYPIGINRGLVQQTLPQLEIENRDIWCEVK